MNEYEKIIKIVVENIAEGKMMKEDAMTILTSLFSIAKGNRIIINEDSKPWPLSMPVIYSDTLKAGEPYVKADEPKAKRDYVAYKKEN